MKKFVFSGKNTILTIIIILVLVVCAIFIRIYIIENKAYSQEKEIAIEKCINLCIDIRNIGGTSALIGCLDSEIIEGWSCGVTYEKVPFIEDLVEKECKNKRHVELNYSCSLVYAK